MKDRWIRSLLISVQQTRICRGIAVVQCGLRKRTEMKITKLQDAQLKTTGKIVDIQVLRGLAIALVLFCHFSISSTILNRVAPTLVNSFYVGVELFFLISGYVVTRSILRGSHHPMVFAIKRVFRLFPVILVGLTFSACTIIFTRQFAPSAWALNFFSISWDEFFREAFAISGGYFINLQGGNTAYQNGAMWSLSVEFQFYAFCFVILMAAHVFKVDKPLLRRIFIATAYALIVLCTYSRLLKGFGYRAIDIDYLIAFRFDFMALGVLLALFQDRLAGVFERLSKFSLLFIVLPLLALAFCRSDLAPPASGSDNRDSWGFFLTQICFFLLLGVAIQGKLSTHRGRIYRFLHLLGERSYTVYVVHLSCMALAWFALYFIDVRLVNNKWIYAIAQPLATFAILIPLTEFIYRYHCRPDF